MDVNYHAPVQLTYELLHSIRKAKGRVINVSSISGVLPTPQFAGYTSAKFALEAFSDVLRYEEHKWGVNVVIIEPSIMKTPMTNLLGENFAKVYDNADSKKKAAYGNKVTMKSFVLKII